MSQQKVDCLFSQFATHSGSLSCSPRVYSRESLVLHSMSYLLHSFFFQGLYFHLNFIQLNICSSQILVLSLKAVGLSMRYSVSVILMQSPSWAAQMEFVSVLELLILSHFLSKSLFPVLVTAVSGNVSKAKEVEKGNIHCVVLISQSMQVCGAFRRASSCNCSYPLSPPLRVLSSL